MKEKKESNVIEYANSRYAVIHETEKTLVLRSLTIPSLRVVCNKNSPMISTVATEEVGK